MVKETRDGSKNMRNWIPLRRLISDNLMESKLIDSLTEAQITKELEPWVGRMFNARRLKNMSLISEVTNNPVEVPKEAIFNRMIPLEDFPIFTIHDPLNILIDYLDSYQAGVQNTGSELPRKRKKSKKHFDGTTNKAKTSSSAWRLLDTSVEEPITVVATPYARTVLSKSIPFKTHYQFVYNNSYFSSTNILSPTNNPNTFVFITNPRQTTSITINTPVSAPQTINPNVTILLPTPSPYKPLTYTIIPPPQP